MSYPPQIPPLVYQLITARCYSRSLHPPSAHSVPSVDKLLPYDSMFTSIVQYTSWPQGRVTYNHVGCCLLTPRGGTNAYVHNVLHIYRNCSRGLVALHVFLLHSDTACVRGRKSRSGTKKNVSCLCKERCVNPQNPRSGRSGILLNPNQEPEKSAELYN